MFSHLFLKIRIVKCVRSRKLPELRAGTAHPTKNKTAQETMKCVEKFLPADRKPRIKFKQIIPWNLPVRLRACVGVTTNQLHTDQKTNGIFKKAVRRVEEGAFLLHSGLSKKWWGEAMECFCNLRITQDQLAGRKSLYERGFGTACVCPVIPFGVEIHFDPTSTQDKSRLHQFGTKVLP